MKLTMEMEMPPENMARLLTWLAAGPDGDVQRADDHQDREHDQDRDDDDAGGGVAGVTATESSGRHVVLVPRDLLERTLNYMEPSSVRSEIAAFATSAKGVHSPVVMFIPITELVSIRSLLVRLQRLIPRQGDEWIRVGEAITLLPS